MSDKMHTRSELLLGSEAMAKLAASHVTVIGIGGVGGHLVEALARSGVGKLTLMDGDVVDPSNLNRQIVALHSTLGCFKAETMAQRVRDINPDCQVTAINKYYVPGFALSEVDFVADAIDDLAAKAELVAYCKRMGIPVVSSMGAGGKLHPERFRLTEIYKTSVCPLARAFRSRLRKLGVTELTVVFSDEPPAKMEGLGSVSFVPGAAGLILAGEIIRQLVSVQS